MIEVDSVTGGEVVGVANFWLWFGRGADILGAISFVISVITLFVTAGIKKAQRHQVEKTDYSEDIDNQIETLHAIHDFLLLKDAADSSVLLELEETLINIEIYYETLLPKKLKTEIKGLKNYMSNNLGKCPYSDNSLKELARRLTIVMAQLRKVKKLL